LQKVTISFIMSVCPHGTIQLSLDRFSRNLTFEYFSQICRENSIFIEIWQKLQVLYMKTYVRTISHRILIRMRNVSDKSCTENQNTHFMFNNFSQKSYHLWDNEHKYSRVRQVTDNNIIWHTSFACWITKAIDTHSECVILIAFPWWQWLCECTSMLCLYVHCLLCLTYGVEQGWVSW
jgi:hypothetical protein